MLRNGGAGLEVAMIGNVEETIAAYCKVIGEYPAFKKRRAFGKELNKSPRTIYLINAVAGSCVRNETYEGLKAAKRSIVNEILISDLLKCANPFKALVGDNTNPRMREPDSLFVSFCYSRVAILESKDVEKRKRHPGANCVQCGNLETTRCSSGGLYPCHEWIKSEETKSEEQHRRSGCKF